MKSLSNTTFWTAISTLFKIVVGLLLVKLFALQFGTAGLGQVANFMTLITVLGVFAGAGIFNGVTKYVAEFEHQPENLTALFSTANRIIVLFSGVLALVFLLCSAQISQWLFYSQDYQTVVIATGIAQFGIANSNYFLAILKGYRNVKATAMSVIIGSLLGLSVFLIGLYGCGYHGALVGLVVMPALVFLPARYFLHRQLQAVKFGRNFAFSSEHAKKLFKFSIMVFITALTLPVAYVLMRDLLVQYHSLEAVGLWQGVSKISDAYLQFITAAFSVYLLPTFARLNAKAPLQQEVVKALKFVGVAALLAGVTIFSLKHWIILLLYSKDFLAMESLFLWQLLGDTCKVLAYVFGYLIVAKASLKLYAVAEILQLGLLVGIGHLFIPHYGAQGAVQAYFATYLVYLLLCVAGFKYYLKHSN
ncbi:lipid III flippase WzxE [Actinobacillus vicugnae]|uniref:lipid III flippase WzxE n=1 Tax=Actinobacillus vicugnae TaxID=2573093 RepID=UPI001240F69F|nr:lipid III flippase WzxE [Actinobacillus vicugnae]